MPDLQDLFQRLPQVLTGLELDHRNVVPHTRKIFFNKSRS
jgi:hypothetical protein